MEFYFPCLKIEYSSTDVNDNNLQYCLFLHHYERNESLQNVNNTITLKVSGSLSIWTFYTIRDSVYDFFSFTVYHRIKQKRVVTLSVEYKKW